MSDFISLGGKYSGVLTKKLQNGSTAFYITFRDFDSKRKRKKVGSSPEMTKAKALQILFETKEEIRAKKELTKNPNSPIPKILQRKIDKKTYTLNDLADYYFEDNVTKTSRSQQNKYNYHFSDQSFATKNVNLITIDDIEHFIKAKKAQRADNRRSNATNVTKLHIAGSVPKRKRKSRAKSLSLIEREQEDYDNNLLAIKKLEEYISLNPNLDTWIEQNKVKHLKEKNKVLSYRLFSEEAKKLDKDTVLDIDQKNRLKGVLSRKTIKELLLLASTIITYANNNKRLQITNEFHITKKNRLYISINNIKLKYLSKDEIRDFLTEIEKVTMENETHNYLYLISLLALSTAARRDTILKIRISDIDLENNIIQLRNFKVEHYFTSAISNPVIKNEIKRIINNRPSSSYLFEGKSGMPITVFPPKMKEVLDYTVNCHKSYLNFLTIKEFRNTVASHLAMSGVPIALIAQILDHASQQTTGIYIQVAPSSAKEEVEKFVSDII